MFILTEKNQAAAVRQALRQRLEGTGVTVAHPGGEVLVLEGETFRLDGESLRLLPGVRAVQRLAEPYPLAARTGHPEDTVVSVGKARIGRDFCLIAGPCAVESSEQVTSIARQVSAAGAQLLRGGAFKPRTSPYTFGGLGAEGLELLCRAGREACQWCRRSPIPGSCRCSGRWTSCRWGHGICRISSCCGSWGGRRSRCC